MLQENKRRLAGALFLIGSAMTLVGCGSSKDDSTGSQYGQPGYGQPGYPGYGGGGSCIPLYGTGAGLQLGFYGQGIRFTGVNLEGGQLPTGASYGTVSIGTGGSGGQYYGVSVDGTISMSVSQGGGGGYPGYGGANAQGAFTINPGTLADIQRYFGGGGGGGGYPPGYPYPQQPPTGGPCIQSVAFSFGTSGNNGLYGNVYLYISGGTTGYRGYRLYYGLPR